MATSLRQQPQLESRMNQESAQRREISTPVDVTNAVLQLICSGYFHDETDDHPKFDIAKQGLLIEKELGLSHLTKIKSGGFGIVYKGQLQDKNGTKKLCAIKVLENRGDIRKFTQRALDEVIFLRDYGHQHILQFYNHWLMKHPERNGACHAIIATEYLDESLQQLWEQQGYEQMDWSTVVKVGRQIGSALEFLHSKNVVHHDVKTMNIMRATSSSGLFKLIDFGLAKKYETSSRECAIYAAGSRRTDFYIPYEVATARRLFTKFNPFLQDSYALGMTLSCILLGLERIKPYFTCSYKVALGFEEVFLQRQADPRAEQLQAIHQLLSPYDPSKRLFIDDFLNRF